ncbi:MAG: hypothetical protein A3E83_01795 [Gammaproteobacteria bacterium RIFCSPHIGHO2_12_FULL_41_20]|nr:MAG: hypothetical protein A3E83_01795 [Gammaproteobacteria bacterium RIFCSPHIGHO2_12_FULL_41_20]
MSDISLILQWINDHPQLAGLAVFLISTAESVAIIGTIIPGSIMMTAIGALAGAGIISLWSTLIWAILGAIVGDGISYWFGFHFKERLPYLWPFRHYPNILKNGEEFFRKHGGKSVFIGRFVGPVRALVPLVAGMLGMHPTRFIIANVVSAIGWAPAYMLPGIVLGAASLELPPDIALHVILALLFFGLFLLFCLWLIYQLFKLVRNQINQFLNWVWQSLLQSKYFHITTIILKHHNIKKTYGQLILAFYFLCISILFIALLTYIKLVGAANIFVNNSLFHLFRSVRTATFDQPMLYITLLGQKQVLLSLIALVTIWLCCIKRWRLAFHVLMLGVLTAGGVFVLKTLAKSPRPWGLFHSPETFSFPSGHTTLATAIYIGLALLIASTCAPKRRWIMYFLGMLLVLIISLSRLYLGVHWFTDILGGWLLGIAILMLVVMSYNRQAEPPLQFSKLLSVILLSLTLSYSVFYIKTFDQAKINYTQLNWPTIEISRSTWWKENNFMPSHQVSLFGFPSIWINIEWVGNLNDIKTTLLQQGWVIPEARDWIAVLHRVLDIKSTEFLPLVSPDYLDKKPVLVLTKKLENSKKILVIRLWQANRIIKDTREPLWVGTINPVPRTYNWLFRRRSNEIDITPEMLFTKPSKKFEWKLVTLTRKNKRQRLVTYNILLIQPKR